MVINSGDLQDHYFCLVGGKRKPILSMDVKQTIIHVDCSGAVASVLDSHTADLSLIDCFGTVITELAK